MLLMQDNVNVANAWQLTLGQYSMYGEYCWAQLFLFWDFFHKLEMAKTLDAAEKHICHVTVGGHHLARS